MNVSLADLAAFSGSALLAGNPPTDGAPATGSGQVSAGNALEPSAFLVLLTSLFQRPHGALPTTNVAKVGITDLAASSGLDLTAASEPSFAIQSKPDADTKPFEPCGLHVPHLESLQITEWSATASGVAEVRPANVPAICETDLLAERPDSSSDPAIETDQISGVNTFEPNGLLAQVMGLFQLSEVSLPKASTAPAKVAHADAIEPLSFASAPTDDDDSQPLEATNVGPGWVCLVNPLQAAETNAANGAVSPEPTSIQGRVPANQPTATVADAVLPKERAPQIRAEAIDPEVSKTGPSESSQTGTAAPESLAPGLELLDSRTSAARSRDLANLPDRLVPNGIASTPERAPPSTLHSWQPAMLRDRLRPDGTAAASEGTPPQAPPTQQPAMLKDPLTPAETFRTPDRAQSLAPHLRQPVMMQDRVAPAETAPTPERVPSHVPPSQQPAMLQDRLTSAETLPAPERAPPQAQPEAKSPSRVWEKSPVDAIGVNAEEILESTNEAGRVLPWRAPSFSLNRNAAPVLMTNEFDLESGDLLHSAPNVDKPATESRPPVEAPNSPTPAPQAAERFAGLLEHLREHGHVEVQMELHPPELGRMQVHMMLEDGQVNVSLVVGNDDARQLLEQQLEPLRIRFMEMGVGLGQFDVRRDANSSDQQTLAERTDAGPFVQTRRRGFAHGAQAVDADGALNSLVDVRV